MATSINIEYNEANVNLHSPREETKVPFSIDIKKEITKFNTKQENKKKLKNEVIKKTEERNNTEANLESKFIDLPSHKNRFTKEASYVKNKMIVLNNSTNRDTYGGVLSRDYGNVNKGVGTSTSQSFKSTAKSGFLYKTHTIRNKFSNSNVVIDKVLAKRIEKINEDNNVEFSGDLSNDNIERYSFSRTDNLANMNINSNANKNITNNDVSPHNENHDQNNSETFKETNYDYPINNTKIIRNSADMLNQAKCNPYETASTIYKVLGKKKNEFLNNMRRQINKMDQSENLLFQKRKFFKHHAMTHYMEKRGRDEVPYVFPIAWIHQNNYGNFSEKNRYEKITELFLKLRYFIEKDEDKEKQYLKEFMMKHGLYEDKYYTIDKLNNFMNFLNSRLDINPSKSMKEIILDAINYKEDGKIAGARTNNNIGRGNSSSPNRGTYSKNFGKRSQVLDRVKVSHSQTRQNIKDERYNMSQYLKSNQPILDDKRFKVDMNNPRSVIDGLEMEFVRLRHGVGGINLKNLNDSNVSYTQRREVKSISTEKRDPSESKRDSYRLKTGLGNINLSISNSEYTLKKDSSVGKYSNVVSSSLKLPKVGIKELDVNQIKKKNKLLEYIVLQRSKSKFQLQQDMKKFKINGI